MVGLLINYLTPFVKEGTWNVKGGRKWEQQTQVRMESHDHWIPQVIQQEEG